MTTLTAVPNPAAGTVTVTIVKTAAVSGLIRADSNGTRLVRVPPNTFPSAGTSGTLTIVDHEAAFTGPVSYRADSAESIFTRFPAGLSPRITDPLQPTAGAWLKGVHGYDSNRDTSATVHDVLGRETPIVVQGVLRSRRGTLEIVVDGHQAATDLETVLGRGRTLQLRQVTQPGLDMYFYATTATKEPEEGNLWKVSTDYVEVDVPAGDRAAETWTFSSLAALPGATFNTVPQSYESFDYLKAGEAL